MAKGVKSAPPPVRKGIEGAMTVHTAPRSQMAKMAPMPMSSRAMGKMPPMPSRGTGSVPGAGKGKGKGMPGRAQRKAPVAF
jgi:hypothetical protein